MRSLHVQASISLELTLNVAGSYLPAIPERGPSYASGGDPPEPEAIEDLVIEHIIFEEQRYTSMYGEQPIKRMVTNDLLEGVDTTAPAVQRLLANLLDCVSAEATEALIEEAGE